ncbi:cobyrinic acid a,c-diamide synthase, partial [Peptococcaceae bacterium SCADC1_2_3]
MFPRVVIAGVQSGVGKTTIATGLMAAMAEKGYRVQGFKAGPDYIDPGYHTAATGNVSRNLDCWMLPEACLKELFLRAAKGTDLAVIEGVMGLYDGYSGRTEAGSTARLAKLLDAPVILVVDANGMARSAAALVLGYKNFDPALNLSGVIFNHVGSEKHYQTLSEAVAEKTGLKTLGYLPKNAALKMPERHLGLLPADEREELTAHLNKLAQAMAEFLNLEEILSVAKSAPPLDYPEQSIFPAGQQKKVRIAVARDAAFNFYYQDALDLLAAWGAELVYFSPLVDSSLPQNIQGVYLGGGFPEMFLEPLARNYSMVESIRRAHKKNMPIYAECGGLMYLSEGIIDFAGSFYPI